MRFSSVIVGSRSRSLGDSGEKLTLSISIFVALQVFYLLLIDLIPPTSFKISLLGTYLLFTLVLVNASIFITIVTINIHWRHPNTHRIPDWARRWFFEILPPYLFLSRPEMTQTKRPKKSMIDHRMNEEHIALTSDDSSLTRLNRYVKSMATEKYPPIIQQAIRDIRYISETQHAAQNDDLVRRSNRFYSAEAKKKFSMLYSFFSSRKKKGGVSSRWSLIGSF